MENIFYALVFLIVLLGLLLFLLFSQRKKEPSINKTLKVKSSSLKDYIDVIEDTNTTTKELEQTLQKILNEYGIIQDLSLYLNLVSSVVKHKNTNKNLILNLEKNLKLQNSKYKKEIEDMVLYALNTRN